MCLSTYDQDVVELLHAVDLGQQLVDHGVVDSRAARHAATLFADGVNLIKYDDVEAAVGTELLSRKTRETYKLMNVERRVIKNPPLHTNSAGDHTQAQVFNQARDTTGLN